jgi:hypothetical protein
MAETLSLLEFIRDLLSDDELRQDFSQNPEATLASHGLADLSPDDVHDALVLAEDNQTADFSRDFNVGNGGGGGFTVPNVHHVAGADSHHEAISYLNNFITNNFVTDNSINQQIDTDGGDFDQDIDVHNATANGAGAVAVGGDVDDSPITTGDGNTVGDGNVRGDGNITGNNNDGNLTGNGDGNVVGDDNQAVTGDHNTTAFGGGDATNVGDVHVGDGGAFGVGSGRVSVDNSDNSQHNSNNTDNSQHDSNNDDHSIHDSGNTETHVDVSDSGNDNSDHSVHDSGNTDTHTEIDHSAVIDV